MSNRLSHVEFVEFYRWNYARIHELTHTRHGNFFLYLVFEMQVDMTRIAVAAIDSDDIRKRERERLRRSEWVRLTNYDLNMYNVQEHEHERWTSCMVARQEHTFDASRGNDGAQNFSGVNNSFNRFFLENISLLHIDEPWDESHGNAPLYRLVELKPKNSIPTKVERWQLIACRFCFLLLVDTTLSAHTHTTYVVATQPKSQ